MFYLKKLLFTFPLFLYAPLLFSFSIDLGDETIQSLQLAEDETILELKGFKKNTIYILNIEGDLNLPPSTPLLLIENNVILIENQEQLTDEDVLYLPVNARTPLEIQIRNFPIDLYDHFDNARWGSFIDKVKESKTPGAVSQKLAEITQNAHLDHVLTVGCESGKDPLFWANQGTTVSILDGTPHAVAITGFRLAQNGYLDRLNRAYICKMEAIPADLGMFDAITGTAAFPFIPPSQFNEVMKNKILSHIIPNGYFAGHFFGPEHEWAAQENMTFISLEDLYQLMLECDFEVVYLEEIKRPQETVFKGNVHWHEIRVIAKKNVRAKP